MPRTTRPPVFVDLDETLVSAREREGWVRSKRPDARQHTCQAVGGYDVVLRPEALEILQLSRAGGREVYLFTMASFGLALEISRAFGLGFGDSTIFSFSMVLNCRRELCPEGALIDDRPYTDGNTRAKADALGIGPERVWLIPAFQPPRYASAKLFVAGLPLRFARLDAAAGRRGQS